MSRGEEVVIFHHALHYFDERVAIERDDDKGTMPDWGARAVCADEVKFSRRRRPRRRISGARQGSLLLICPTIRTLRA